MAEPLRQNEPTIPENLRPIEASTSADVPTYDTYPAEPPRTSGWRPSEQRSMNVRNPQLDERAHKIGSFVGDVVNRGREAFGKVDAMKSDVRRSSGDRVQELKQRAEEKWSNARSAARERLEDWRETARDSANNAKDAVVQRTREARIRAKAYTNENPYRVLLGIAGAAFAIGLTARIMRRSRD
jgi:ElaB/YqjD/DUF883 family membrane-anchored ribosome-binding protein